MSRVCCMGNLQVVFWTFAIICFHASYGRTKLYVGGLFAITRKGSTGTKGYHAMIGGEMAVEDVNNATSILPDYELIYTVYDSKVSFYHYTIDIRPNVSGHFMLSAFGLISMHFRHHI